jgi:leader peptidase (prepilin peptidase)/N-methyltransferase
VPELIFLIPLAFIFFLAIPLAVIDFREHRLPNQMTVSAIAVTFLSLLSLAVFSARLIAAVTGLLAGGITFWIGYLLAKRDAIGMGDIKLLTSLNALAAYFSPLLAVLSMTTGLVMATLASTVLLATRKITPSAALPLGPYLLLGFFTFLGPAACLLTAEVLS